MSKGLAAVTESLHILPTVWQTGTHSAAQCIHGKVMQPHRATT